MGIRRYRYSMIPCKVDMASGYIQSVVDTFFQLWIVNLVCHSLGCRVSSKVVRLKCPCSPIVDTNAQRARGLPISLPSDERFGDRTKTH